MNLQKLGITLAEKCAQYAKNCGKSSILCTKPAQIRNITKLKYIPKLSEDVFTKQTLKDVVSTHNLNSYINKKFLLGEGTEASVYKIGETPYVLRIPHTDTTEAWKGIFTRGKTVDMSKLDLAVTPQDRVNNIVARIGDAQILKYIEGKNTVTDFISSESEIIKSINNLSTDSIKDYFLTLAKANRVGMKHDYIGDNCIINCATGKLSPVDFLPGQDFKLLNSLMDQCARFPQRIGGTNNQNNLLKKGLTAILELVKEGKISAKELDLSKVRLIFNETDSAKNLLSLCKDYSTDSSIKNIDRILAELKNMV